MARPKAVVLENGAQYRIYEVEHLMLRPITTADRGEVKLLYEGSVSGVIQRGQELREQGYHVTLAACTGAGDPVKFKWDNWVSNTQLVRAFPPVHKPSLKELDAIEERLRS